MSLFASTRSHSPSSPAAGGASARLRALVAERLAVDEAVLSPSVSLVDDLAADSLDLADLAAAIESDFDVTVPLEWFAGLHTFGDLARIVDGLAHARALRPRRRVAAAVARPIAQAWGRLPFVANPR